MTAPPDDSVTFNDSRRKQPHSQCPNQLNPAPPSRNRTQKRSGFTANLLCRTLKGLYKHVGMNGATSHSEQRSFTPTLASKRIGVRALASLAGHRSMNTTQAYIEVNDAMKQAAVELAA
jgi:integrase/recombinase XerD